MDDVANHLNSEGNIRVSSQMVSFWVDAVRPSFNNKLLGADASLSKRIASMEAVDIAIILPVHNPLKDVVVEVCLLHFL